MKKTKWIFIYWMPYDNNLSHLKDTIIQMLVDGCKSKDLVIYVFSDSYNQDYVTKTGISKEGVFQNIEVKSRDSSDPTFVLNCLNDLSKEIESEKWGFTILGHGGRIDEISPDENTGKNLKEKFNWMNIFELNKVLLDFTSQIGKKLDLIFLQNCCKGTIEANFNFRKVTNNILSSQKPLGAPNYYYENTFSYLSKFPEISGDTLGRMITETESNTMFDSYSLIQTLEIEEFTKKLNTLITAILIHKNVDRIRFNSYSYSGEQLVDLGNFFWALSKGNIETNLLYWDLIKCYTEKVLVHHKINPVKLNENLSGLSVFFPNSLEETSTYSYLDFYKEVKMEKLFQKIIKS